MNWINNFFGVIILNSITGGLAHLVWFFVRRILERRDKIKLVYPLLKIVIIFYSIPIVYTVLTLASYSFKNGYSISGVQFLLTPTIANVIKYLAVIWFIGMLWNFSVYFMDYMRLRKLMKWNIRVTNKKMLQIFNDVYQRLNVKEKVSFYQNYSLTSPIVMGSFRKSIILPDRPYIDRELEAVLYHEFTHVTKKDLFYKKLSILLNLIIWFNPFVYKFRDDFEEWSETDCDLKVCYLMKCPLNLKEYFNYALKGLHDNYSMSTRLAMQFNNEHSLKRRVLRMKYYKKDRELKRYAGVVLALVFSLVCTSTALAAGKGAMELYEVAYEETVQEVSEGEAVQGNYLTEYVIPASEAEKLNDNFDIYSPLIRSVGVIDFSVGANNQTRTLSFSKSTGVIGVSILVSKTATIGIIEPDGARRYVTGNGMVSHSFIVNKSGLHSVYVQNNNSTSLTAEGTYMY